MQIIYFVADKGTAQIDQSTIDELGLGYAFDSKPAARAILAGKGPEGNGGVCLGRSIQGLAYRPDIQRWEPKAGTPGVWIGIQDDNLPTPSEMVRPSWKSQHADSELAVSPNLLSIDSHDLIAGPNIWPIPIARQWSQAGWQSTLPRNVRYVSEGGKNVFKPGETIAEFRRIEELAATIQECWQEGKVPDDFYQIAAEILSIPYFIGPQEMAMMGLVGDQVITVANLLWLVIDEPGFIEMVKKKADLEGESTTFGSED